MWLLLKCIDRATLWSLHYLKPLPYYTTQRVALLGDAVSHSLQRILTVLSI